MGDIAPKSAPANISDGCEVKSLQRGGGCKTVEEGEVGAGVASCCGSRRRRWSRFSRRKNSGLRMTANGTRNCRRMRRRVASDTLRASDTKFGGSLLLLLSLMLWWRLVNRGRRGGGGS
jgi:hypothetical protein